MGKSTPQKDAIKVYLFGFNVVLVSARRCSFRKPQRTFRVVLGWADRGLTGGFLLLQNFSVVISVSPHVCFILVLILISMFLK